MEVDTFVTTEPQAGGPGNNSNAVSRTAHGEGSSSSGGGGGAATVVILATAVVILAAALLGLVAAIVWRKLSRAAPQVVYAVHAK